MAKKFSVLILVVMCLGVSSSCLYAGENTPGSSVNGKYSNLIQVMNCPKDRSSYGEFRDYGYWGGGPWCGQTGKAGYWVWVAPDWYVWAEEASSTDQASSRSSANGKYADLVQIMNCPSDRSRYGGFRDYGYWGGGPWCGQTGKAGYWVWVAPDWYVWKRKAR